MNIKYYKEYSPILDREMECKVYGDAGVPFLFIPCQEGRFYDFENFRMIEPFARYIEEGRVQVFSVDSLDAETLTSKDWDKHKRMEVYEKWVEHIAYEFVPWLMDRSYSGKKPIVFGCSLGALHAANLFFRFPDRFGGVLALSGLYQLDFAFGDYHDDLTYRNSPVDYLRGMEWDHPYVNLYNEGKMIFVVGQGAWEDETKPGTADLDAVCKQKGIQAEFNYWGYDVKHDWDWWFRQVDVYLPAFLY